MDIHAVLQAQAGLLIVLGLVVLLAHQTSYSSEVDRIGHWFFAAMLCGGLGLALQAERGHLSPFATIVGGNLLFLLLTVLLTRSIALLTGTVTRAIPHLMGLVAATVLALAYFTFPHPDVARRVLIASVSVPVLLLPATAMLLRVREHRTRIATYTLAAIILLFDFGALGNAIKILRGARPQTGASWGGTILIAGMAICFLWIDMLRARADLERQALTDPLTGLMNRRAMELFAPRELARAARQSSVITLLSIDVDHFKGINDTYGHSIGDSALRGIAQLLRETLRATDLASRTGGDEFVVLLPDSSREVSQMIRDRFREGIRHMAVISHDGQQVAVSASIGTYTTGRLQGRTYADMVHASDLDLYRQKQLRPFKRDTIVGPR
jgi:diguanylate cyclase (GGDEF)-like protein